MIIRSWWTLAIVVLGLTLVTRSTHAVHKNNNNNNNNNSRVPLDGLVSFWDFQEPTGPFVAKLGAGHYALEAQVYDNITKEWSAGAVDRVRDAPPGTPFGPQSARIAYGQMLVVPETASKAPLLDIHGDNATLSVVVWMKADTRFQNATDHSANFGHLAGIWSEPLNARRYVVFGRNPRGKPCETCTSLDVEVSRTGASIPPCRWSISYAVGSANVTYEEWHVVALTFDGREIRSYVNGTLDIRPPDRINPASDPCNETWANPAEVATWSNRSSWGPGGDPAFPSHLTDFAVGGQKAAEGKTYGHPWTGLVGGLAVYSRALEPAELAAMAAAAAAAAAVPLSSSSSSSSSSSLLS